MILSGVSTASLYPLHTEDALRTVAELGVKNAEIFINDVSELEGEIFDDMLKTVRDYDMNILSVHPFSSPMESAYMFSEYDRRQNFIFDMYRRFFERMGDLGARIFVLHGSILSTKCSDERYFTQFSKLLDIAEEYGVTIGQENICYCKSKDIGFLKRLREQCGERTKFVLDIKQAVRAGISPYDILDELGNDVVHIHISDNTPEKDCLPIGSGSFDYERFTEKLVSVNYSGGMLVELYRHNYERYEELYEGMKKIQGIIAKFQKM